MPRAQSEIFAEKLREVEHPFQHEPYAFTHWTYLVAVKMENVPTDEIARTAPSFTMKQCLEFLDKKDIEGLHNCGVPFEVDGIESGRVCWLVEAENRQKEDPVVVFMHGGNYLYGLYPYHVNFIRATWQNLEERDRVSVLVMDYSTSATAKYPKQIDELTRLSNELSKSCSRIVQFGANCGAHMIMLMLRHTQIPIEGVVPLKEEAKPFVVTMISPMTNIAQKHEHGTYLSNKQKEYVDLQLLREYNNYWLDGDTELERSPKLSPRLDTEVDWSELMPKDNTAVWWGSQELMAQDTRYWCEKMAKLPQDHYVESPDGTTDAPVAELHARQVELEPLSKWFSKRL